MGSKKYAIRYESFPNENFAPGAMTNSAPLIAIAVVVNRQTHIRDALPLGQRVGPVPGGG